MITINEQTEEARKVEILARDIARQAKRLANDEMTNEQRYALWGDIQAGITVMRMRAENARDGD
jgi:hypothetical protein